MYRFALGQRHQKRFSLFLSFLIVVRSANVLWTRIRLPEGVISSSIAVSRSSTVSSPSTSSPDSLKDSKIGPSLYLRNDVSQSVSIKWTEVILFNSVSALK